MLEQTRPPWPVYTYALQAGWQQYEAGNLRAIDEFQCDYVLTNDHPLSPVRLDTALLAQLPAMAQHVARFTPAGWPVRDVAHGLPAYDPIDAYFVPVADFGALRQPGPSINLWRVRAAPVEGSATTSARELLARAILRGALSALESGRPEDFAQLQHRSRDIFPAAMQSASYHRELGWSRRRLGNPQQAAAEWQQSLQADPANDRLWLELGLLAAGELDDVEMATACFRRVLALNPEHRRAPQLQAYLAARS